MKRFIKVFKGFLSALVDIEDPSVVEPMNVVESINADDFETVKTNTPENANVMSFLSGSDGK